VLIADEVGKNPSGGLALLTVALLALVAYGLTRAPSVVWTAGVSDSAELSAAAYVLGIPHPTGYPLYMLLGWPISHLAVLGEPAQALTWLSVLCGAAAATLAGATAWTLTLQDCSRRRIAHVTAIVVAGVGCLALPPLWLQATAPETRSLALALVLGTVLLLVRIVGKPTTSRLAATWFVFGLALADHLFCLALLPGLLLLTLSRPSNSRLWRRICTPAALLPGVGLYLYLPLRAAAHPVMNWGDPHSINQFLWEVSGAQYRSLMGPAHLDLGDRVLTVWQATGPTYAIVGVLGLALLIARRPLLGIALASICLASVAISALYSAVAAPVYLLPCEAMLCVAAGYLAAYVLQLIRSATHLGPLLLVLVAVAVGSQFVSNLGQAQAFYTSADASVPASYSRTALAGLPHGALLLTTGDDHTFSLWYAQVALGMRPDVALVSTDLLAWTWYRDELQHRYPWLRWGAPWGPDTGDPVSRATERGVALAAAMAGRRPLFWTDPFTVPVGRCGLVSYANLFRCVPLRSGLGS
jgi:hypothetical protein